MILEEELEKIEARYHKTQPAPWKAYIKRTDHDSGSDFIMTGKSEIEDRTLSY